jgi:hypothetical protein
MPTFFFLNISTRKIEIKGYDDYFSCEWAAFGELKTVAG